MLRRGHGAEPLCEVFIATGRLKVVAEDSTHYNTADD